MSYNVKHLAAEFSITERLVRKILRRNLTERHSINDPWQFNGNRVRTMRKIIRRELAAA